VAEPTASGRERRIDLPFRPGEMPPLFGDTAALLIVDDDPATVRLLEAMLEPEGYECTGAHSAEEALARLAEKDFAVALVDVLMPGQTGLELVDQALELYPFLAVVMVTGVDDPRIAELALRTGAYGYLLKPFTHTEVAVAVSNAGRRRCLEIESAVYRRRLETHLAEQAADLEDALTQLKALRADGSGSPEPPA
jgi:two-component system, NtrC family, C4-dicarboxylate transport response regulator DctD